MRFRRAGLYALGLGCLLAMARPGIAAEWFLRMEVDGRRVDGLPLHWDQKEFHLLERDGQIRTYGMEHAESSERIRESFREYGQAEMRAHLAAEFGRAFEVTATGNYLVAHPVGQSDKWPQRFEQLYREMLVYFGTRGINLQRPQFPLVAIVFPNQAEFIKYSHSIDIGIGGNVLGYYSHITNRIYLFDESAGGRFDTDWRKNAETIVHEAAHQTAFNTGVHQRLAPTPRWVVEGLGTLFEAPGVYDASRHRERFERINHDRLGAYKRGFKKKLPQGAVQEIVASDRLFQSSAGAAYTIAWALTFMLAETEPRQYAEYLQVTSRAKPFQKDSPVRRLRDFQSVFGSDFRMIESRLHRYMVELD